MKYVGLNFLFIYYCFFFLIQTFFSFGTVVLCTISEAWKVLEKWQEVGVAVALFTFLSQPRRRLPLSVEMSWGSFGIVEVAVVWVGSWWAFPPQQWIIWLSLRWDGGVTGQVKQTKSKGAKWSPPRPSAHQRWTTIWRDCWKGQRGEGGKIQIGQEWKMRGRGTRGTHPSTGVLTTHRWMNRLPSALTVANKGQRERGRQRRKRWGELKGEMPCFLTSHIAAGKDNRSRVPVQTSWETSQYTPKHTCWRISEQSPPRGNISRLLTV